MKTRHLLALGAAMSGLLVLAAAEAEAQQRAVGGGPRVIPRSHSNHFSWEGKHGFHGGFPGVILVEREVVRVVEPLRQAQDDRPEKEPAAPPPPPRKPYVIGNSYASLPGGCMKLIEEGVSYYWCSGGEWYRQLGAAGGVKYRAVTKP